jgi:hypothetical protein
MSGLENVSRVDGVDVVGFTESGFNEGASKWREWRLCGLNIV